MAGTSIYSVYRRTARAAAKQQVVKKTSSVDVEKARTDFAYFCDVVGDKPPATHHKEWHRYLCTGDDSECLVAIGGPNIDILAQNEYGVQAFSYSDFIFGVQFHPEFNFDVMKAYYSIRIEKIENKEDYYVCNENEGIKVVDNFINMKFKGDRR